MILETERLILRGWRDEDAPSLFKYASDRRVGPVAGWLPHRDVNYSRAVIRTVFASDETYAICLRDGDDEPIGSIGLTLKGTPERPLMDLEAELGYWVGVPFWGQGIATEASKEMLRHAFLDLGIKRVLAGYFHGNDRSRRVQEKCGLRPFRTLDKSYIPMLSEVRTEHFTAITYEEWRQQNLL